MESRKRRQRSSSGQQTTESQSKSRKLNQDKDDDAIPRIKAIIEREFGREIASKEDEAEEIQIRITEVRKALQVVRYGAVTNYYAQSVVKQSGSCPTDVSIHPATRSVLAGKRPKRAAAARTRSAAAAKSTTKEPQTATTSQVKKEPDLVEPPPFHPLAATHTVLRTASAAPRAERHRVKRRFIVGNVSKWIECDQREDLATHKWMIYVRGGGGEGEADVSDVVTKVCFLIHPSYSPHDLVEVSQPPFHLTRRGWGEFPARVQIHFKDGSLNRPVDVIHHLKLDRTYTGLQTLGSETVIDIWLYVPEVGKSKSDENEPKFESEGWVIPATNSYPELASINHDSEVFAGQENSTTHLDESITTLNSLKNLDSSKKTKKTPPPPQSLLKVNQSRGGRRSHELRSVNVDKKGNIRVINGGKRTRTLAPVSLLLEKL